MASVDQVLGSKYRLVERLGAGGMGEVWLAQHLDLDRDVAVKLLSSDNDATALKRFEREARLAAKLKSPHVAQIFDVGQHEGRPYLVMERLVGEDLHARLALGPLNLEEVARLVDGACAALAEAHGLGIVHRDIKPANLFFANTGGRVTLKILDFGIATRNGATGPLTSEGTIIGTPQYMSPEQSQGQAVDHRSDLWSLAVVAYQALTGANPFDGRTDWESLAAIARRPVPPPSTRVEGLPPAMDAFFQRALRRNPAQRHPTASSFATCFQAALRGEDLAPPDTSADTTPMQLGDAQAATTSPQTDGVAVRRSDRTAATMRTGPWLLAAAAVLFGSWLGLTRDSIAPIDRAMAHSAARVHTAALLIADIAPPKSASEPIEATLPMPSAATARPAASDARPRPSAPPPPPKPANEFGI